MDVVAPGTNILSTVQGNAYAFDTGTSMAAPQVAGVAALLLSLNPCLSQRQVADVIMRSAFKMPGFNFNINRPPNGTWNNEVGHGIVDAFDALRLVQTLIIQDQTIAPTLPVNTGQLFANPIGDVWAGRNVDVTGSYAVNDVAVTQGANVTFQSSQRIRLANGFRVLANTGNPTAPTRFRATIQPNFNGGCNGWISTRIAPEPPSQQAEPVSDFAVKKFSSSDGYALSLYPNPNNGRFSLSYQRENEERKEGIAIQVSNVLGQMVFLQNLDANANTDGLEIQLDQAKLKTGIYFLQLREGNQCSNLKFIVHEN